MNVPQRNSVASAEAAARKVLEASREVIGATAKTKTDQRHFILYSSLDYEITARETVQRARKSDKAAIKACLEYGAQSIRAGGSLSGPLAEFITDFLTIESQKPIPPSRFPHLNYIRDLVIAMAVSAAADEGGLLATRNVATRDKSARESGSSVVARVLPEFGLNLSEEGVGKVWKAHKD